MKKKKIDYDDLDDLFEKAVLEVAEINGKQYMEEADADPYFPSFEFNQRISKLLEDHTKPQKPQGFFNNLYLTLSKASMWILLVLILLFVTVPNIASARNWITKLVIESNEKYAKHYIQSNELTSSDTQDTGFHGLSAVESHYPSYLPEGMTLFKFSYDSTMLNYWFMDGSSQYVNIEVFGSDTIMHLDNEELEEQNIELINDIEVHYTKKLGKSSFVWADHDQYFVLDTNMSDKEEVLKIVDGMLSNN